MLVVLELDASNRQGQWHICLRWLRRTNRGLRISLLCSLTCTNFLRILKQEDKVMQLDHSNKRTRICHLCRRCGHRLLWAPRVSTSMTSASMYVRFWRSRSSVIQVHTVWGKTRGIKWSESKMSDSNDRSTLNAFIPQWANKFGFFQLLRNLQARPSVSSPILSDIPRALYFSCFVTGK